MFEETHANLYVAHQAKKRRRGCVQRKNFVKSCPRSAPSQKTTPGVRTTKKFVKMSPEAAYNQKVRQIVARGCVQPKNSSNCRPRLRTTKKSPFHVTTSRKFREGLHNYKSQIQRGFPQLQVAKFKRVPSQELRKIYKHKGYSPHAGADTAPTRLCMKKSQNSQVDSRAKKIQEGPQSRTSKKL